MIKYYFIPTGIAIMQKKKKEKGVSKNVKYWWEGRNYNPSILLVRM